MKNIRCKELTFYHLLKQSFRNYPLKTNNQTKQTRFFTKKDGGKKEY